MGAEAPVYRCTECGVVVIVSPDREIARACGHDGAGVVVDMSAHVTASGRVSTR